MSAPVVHPEARQQIDNAITSGLLWAVREYARSYFRGGFRSYLAESFAGLPTDAFVVSRTEGVDVRRLWRRAATLPDAELRRGFDALVDALAPTFPSPASLLSDDVQALEEVAQRLGHGARSEDLVVQNVCARLKELAKRAGS